MDEPAVATSRVRIIDPVYWMFFHSERRHFYNFVRWIVYDIADTFATASITYEKDYEEKAQTLEAFSDRRLYANRDADFVPIF